MKRGTIAAMVGTILLGGALGSAFAVPASAATTIPISMDLGTVMPGESHSDTVPVEIPITSSVNEAVFVVQDGDAAWSADLCDTTGSCTDVADLSDARLVAGDYTLTVSVTMPDDATQRTTASASGVIRLIEIPEALPLTELARTGGGMPLTAAIGGTIALGAGVIMIIAERRRRTTEGTRTRA